MAAPPVEDVEGSITARPGGQPSPVTRQADRDPGRVRRRSHGPSRRTFLRTAMALSGIGAIGSLGASSLAFLWPNLRGGFGAVSDVGTPEEVLANIQANGNRWEFPPRRTLFVRYEPALDPSGQYAAITNGTGVMALYWKCVHLGCKVPWCATSQWWECPCHGSRYNRWGEYQAGPAPRGLDRFLVSAEDGRLLLDTSSIVTGPSRGGGVLDQPPEGPTCV